MVGRHFRKVYWSECGSVSSERRIMEASMDGSNMRTLVTGVRCPGGLHIDLPLRRLYWTEQFLNVIDSIGVDGTNRRVRALPLLTVKPRLHQGNMLHGNMLLVAGNMLLEATCCRQQNCCQFVARLLLCIQRDTCCRDTGNTATCKQHVAGQHVALV